MNNSSQLLQDLLEHEEQLNAKLKEQDELESKLVEEVEKHVSTVTALRNDLQRISSEFAEAQVNASNTLKDKECAQKVQEMLLLYEKLKTDEKHFKESCQVELQRLQAMYAQADIMESPGSELQSQLTRSRAKVETGRIELAAISRNLSNLKCDIDQIPSRAELREYRLRFTELYNQVSATHRQTKQYFSLYNSLEDTKRYMEKELSLLNSIVDSYQMVCNTTAGREDYLRQLTGLSDGIKDSCGKVDKQLQIEKLSVAKLQQEMQTLVEQKVAYEKCLLDLEAECKLNDQLLTSCKKLQSQQRAQAQ